MSSTRSRTLRSLFAIGLVTSSGLFMTCGSWSASAAKVTFHVSRILSAKTLHHTYSVSGSSASKTETLANPDDITQLGSDLFVGFQNGVGPQGQASTDGNRDSTVVQFTTSGHVVNQWDVVGKADGVTGDPGVGVLVTVNEDANSALYVINPNAPAASAVTHYAYNEPLAHEGGTDAISTLSGEILISASAPGTTGTPAPKATYPAVYSVSLSVSSKVAVVTPLFYDESSATVVNITGAHHGTPTKLALTDPDSSEIVPSPGPRFAGDFMLTSQGDKKQIYVKGAGTSHQSLQVLSLTQSVDDTAWPSGANGSLYSTDSTNDAIDVVTGPFVANQPVVVVTPCGANGSPATCPAAKYPANYLGVMNASTGAIARLSVTGSAYTPQGGLAFVAG